MQNFNDINENYSSGLINDLLKNIKPEEQEQTDYKMKLAARIYAALKSKGWKSVDLAEALHLKSPSIVSKWLSGTHNFTVDTLVEIQRVLEIRLLDEKLTIVDPILNVNLTVSAKPSSLNGDIREHLQRVIDETYGSQVTTITARYS
ncbi:MAG: helix-turn-helix transcriptional regulator [Bacteroidota bacterium]|nr:helix-turn-helix transcriptional regulator [Bacteroidota bacterium]MDP4251613.1 helix-turn-helix transcriptional regulator [Bacteroidota bacterium]